MLERKIIFILAIIIVMLIILLFFFKRDNSHEESQTKNNGLEIITNQSIDFENAVIDGDNVKSNDLSIPIQHSSTKSINTKVDIDRSREGNKSLLFSLPPNDSRSEIRIIDIPNNSTKFIGFSVFFPKDYKPPTDWNLFAQWWQGSPASPPIAFEITPNSDEFKMRILTRHGQYQHNNITVQYNKTIEKDNWIDFMIEMRIDDSGGLNGILNVWKNGKEIVKYNGPLGYPNLNNTTNFRLGLYRYPFINSSAKVYFDEIKIGDRLKK
ncbi:MULTISPECIES: heparin lyase I family protein [Metabacillus]|uniref:Polysaccharide lyase n=2 Tax=Metabacillus TaxID=2675233 RepID=A0A179T6W6_9BACI|nr:MULTISPECIES: heparin lyase I family protein [Metabacillus]OAS88192.1 hypothetical protein A6K24_17610 [Metabacillus litoralis]QNF27377.1 heparin lyase I family protein [Metabacillus sp. KUDC1714]